MLMFSIEKLTEKMKLTITKKIDSEYKGHSILMGLLVITPCWKEETKRVILGKIEFEQLDK